MRSGVMWLVPVILLLVGGCTGDAGPTPDMSQPTETTVAPRPTLTAAAQPSHVFPPDEAIKFTLAMLGAKEVGIVAPTTMAFGPDGRLYVGQLDGPLLALRLEDNVIVDAATIAPTGVFEHVLGLAFNPAEPPDPVTLYVSHTVLFAGEAGAPYPGTISRLVAPDYQPVDVISGLPVSTVEHGTNGIAFDNEGLLYIAQGATTNAGVPSQRHPRPETPLSGAILVADLNEPTFDGAVRYEPAETAGHDVDQVAGDVRVYASGFRNPYDLVVHSNGNIYATDNGPNIPDGVPSLSCLSQAIADVEAADELNLIVEGQYYGHPNRNRGRFDEEQCIFYGPGDASGASTAPLATLGFHVSANGIAEYTSDAFGGRLRGNLIYVEWKAGRIWRVVLSEDGQDVVAISRLHPHEFLAPIDVVVGPDGTVYVSQLFGASINYLSPVIE